MESSIIENQKNTPTFRMYLTTALCLMPGFTGGAAISYAAISIPYYMDPNNGSSIHMTEAQASWFVSLNSPMQMVGNLLAGWAMDKLGRKRTIMVSCVLVILASFILTFAPTYEILLIGCLLNGTSVGLVRPPIILLLLEISLIRSRGFIGSLNSVTPNAGYLYGQILGSMVPIHIVPWIMVAPCAVFLVFSWYVVRSPVWLMKYGRSEESRQVVIWLRGPDYKFEPEMKEMEHLLNTVFEAQVTSGTTTWYDRTFLLPLFILSSMFFFHASFGADDLTYYGLTIFHYASLPNISPNLIAILFQLSFTVGLVVSQAVSSSVGRRMQFIGGSIGLTVILAGLGVYHQAAPQFAVGSLFAWTPVVLHVAMGLVFGAGVGSVPYTLTGELFPQHLKTLGCGVALAVRYLGQFVQLKMFVVCRAAIGMTGVYWLHSGTAMAAAVFVFFLLPETRNKSYSQLDEMFKKKTAVDVEKPK